MKRVLILAVLLAACLGCAATAFAQQIGSYPYATTPLLGTEQMVGNQAATYPCVGCTVTITPAMIADYTFGLAPAFSILYNNNGAPGGLIPSATGQFCLNWSSLTAAPTLVTCSSGGGMVYPGAGIPDSTGTAWGTSYSTTGSGDVVLSTSPTLVTPALGTPSAIVLTNATGLPYSALTSGTNTAAAMLVGTGASLGPTGTGTVSANEINGVIQGVTTATAGNTLTPDCAYSMDKVTATTYLIPAPTQSAPTTASTGGSLAGNTYYYVVTAETAIGQTTASGQQSITSDTDAPPTNGALTATSGGTLAATTYYVRSTWVTASGQTTGATETSLAVAADNVLNVAAPASPPSNATGWNVYVSTATGTETLQNSSPIGTTTAWVEPTTGLVAGSSLPSSNTAWLTSTNENVISWTAVTGATGYIVYRSTTPSDFTDATSYTVSGGTTATFTDTGATGTTATPPTVNTTGEFTVETPTGCTPTDGQKLEVKIISPAGGLITYAWPSTIIGSTQLALPLTSAGAGLEDYFQLQDDADLGKWVMLSYNQGF